MVEAGREMIEVGKIYRRQVLNPTP